MIDIKCGKGRPLNNIPLSSACVPMRIIEHIIPSNVDRLLEGTDFFNPYPHGFREGYSSESKVITFGHDLTVQPSRYRSRWIYFFETSLRNSL